ncbi:MAG: helix-turn-helix domain-containing protein [Oscillibacter sp.]|uniref:helix-turn-helix domain-containing protein n=1 Tax=uncultured Oscillibacter sp. TaxID=876091 RepID=UPI00216C4B96|nr:helix-turn-helix domain-containing protein [uncultured Oscillibacter sp.]MCI9610385.1 helix-turn-helix domain-containing protein [Oscillibacter sp.]
MTENTIQERPQILTGCRSVMTVEQCAEALQLCTKQIRILYHAKEIQGFQVGRAIRILRSSVEDYILRQMKRAG